MQNPNRVQIIEADQHLERVLEHDDLREDPVLVQQAGDRPAGHPLHEQVEAGLLADGAEHPDHVRVVQPGQDLDLVLDQLLHDGCLLLGLPVVVQVDLLDGHEGARLDVPGLVAGAVGAGT